ncbi:MAG: FAD-dependent oxidoreductase [Eubacterium sp.]|nr:FAD-dependent oxidoreductase [Eubacterium sp.]
MYDVLIIGAGPAGLSAAVYLKRAMLSVAIIEKQPLSGGQILTSYNIENYLGFTQISGTELAEKFKKHAEAAGACFISGEVLKINKNSVELNNGKTISAKAIIIASGASHRHLGIKGEKEFIGKGISYCAACDGSFFADKSVAVIGGGDAALENALYLSNICKRVTLIHRRKKLRAAEILSERFFSKPNTEFIPNDEALEFCGNEKLTNIILKSGKTLTAEGAFIAIGQSPQTKFISKDIKTNVNGYIITDNDCLTSEDGIFAIGDVREKSCRQIITAAADGAVVSQSVLNYINSL